MLSEIGSNFWLNPYEQLQDCPLGSPSQFNCNGDDFVWLSTGRSAIKFVIIDIEKRNSGLKKVNNPDIIDPATGFEYDGETATLSTAVNGGDTYYTDYVVYIASSGGDMTGMNLTAKLNVSDAIYTQLTDVSGDYDTWNAVSVDFYVSNKSNYTYEEESVSKPKGIYKGTLSLKNSTLAADAGAHSSSTPLSLLSNSTIPASNSTTDYLVVTMRVYFDGASVKTAGQSYIHTNAANTNGIAFTAIFDCATAS